MEIQLQQISSRYILCQHLRRHIMQYFTGNKVKS